MAGGRPVIFLVHGSYVTAGMAVSEGMRIRDSLARGVVTQDAIVVEFNWPSERVYANLFRDVSDKGRRAFVAGYHLARFLQGFPSGSRISLIGHSHGGWVVLSALQLLAGGTLDNGDEATVLTAISPALRLRAILIASAIDRQWIDPGERFARSLEACEGIFCLYNPLDPVLALHPFAPYSDGQRALGKCGMNTVTQERLGPLAGRYRQRSLAGLLGPRHTFRGTIENPMVARWIAPYTWAW
jgi:Alpha/beta hydrolase of unknown function (DUF900)